MLDESLNLSGPDFSTMSGPDDETEVAELSEIYAVLRDDAKTIVNDLKGGVAMWREAAGANVATAGFLLILALTTWHSGPSGFEGTILVGAQLLLAAVMLGFAAFGFRKYFQLVRKYQGLFKKAEKLV
jgi:hypothetical protein